MNLKYMQFNAAHLLFCFTENNIWLIDDSKSYAKSGLQIPVSVSNKDSQETRLSELCQEVESKGKSNWIVKNQ